METKIIRKGLERVKYIMIRRRKELTNLELLLKFIVFLVILAIFYLFSSSFVHVFFESNGSLSSLISFVLTIFVFEVFEYLGKKERDKGRI
jgi:uncharacterized membrane protein YjjP (DUF1212 family)